MKIKTVTHACAEAFDIQVNRLLAEGYMLDERHVLMTSPVVTYYAQLVLDEPENPPERQPVDPIVALQALRDFCDSNKCEDCRLYDFCNKHLPTFEGPADWKLPGEEAEQ